MKLFKKVSVMMVSLLMALAMMVPVAAADATVTIKNKGDNEELKYIQVIIIYFVNIFQKKITIRVFSELPPK